MKNIVRIRAILSSLLLLVFILILFTGLGLFLAPSGKNAKQIEWLFFGFDKWQLENLHTVLGLVMLILVVLHLLLNYKMLINEIKILFHQ